MTTRKDIFIYTIIALSICLLIIVVATTNPFDPEVNNDQEGLHNVQMTIITPNWTVSYTSTNTTNVTVSDLLLEWATASNITIETEFFSGYDSSLITGINGTVNGQNDSYWQFYVNGEYSTLGSNNYYLHENDQVEWRFEKSPW
jgi:hypothetical protein